MATVCWQVVTDAVQSVLVDVWIDWRRQCWDQIPEQRAWQSLWYQLACESCAIMTLSRCTVCVWQSLCSRVSEWKPRHERRRNSRNVSDDDDDDDVVDTAVGMFLFALYHVSTIIVLINMLIAMMSHSFEAIQVHICLSTCLSLCLSVCLCVYCLLLWLYVICIHWQLYGMMYYHCVFLSLNSALMLFLRCIYVCYVLVKTSYLLTFSCDLVAQR